MNKDGHHARVYRHQDKMWVEIDQCMLASFDEIEELVDGVHSFEELADLFKEGMLKSWAAFSLCRKHFHCTLYCTRLRARVARNDRRVDQISFFLFVFCLVAPVVEQWERPLEPGRSNVSLKPAHLLTPLMD